ncbi:MAG: hypothetical protein M3Q23_06645 [Actinomycetota bacterium]|nr:hypothetical protein [Actinomycetota bacterium]
MTRVDERIRGEMQGLGRAVDSRGVLERVARKRSRRRVVRRFQASALAVAVVGGSVAGGVGLIHLFGHKGTVTPSSQFSPKVSGLPDYLFSPKVSGPAPTSAGGSPQPSEKEAICDHSQLNADVDGDGVPDQVDLFSPAPSCDSPEAGQRWVLHVSGGKLGPSGPGVRFYGADQDLPDCAPSPPLQACRLFAAPDLNGDGQAELAIEMVQDSGTAFLFLFELEGLDTAAGPRFVRIDVASPGDPWDPAYGFDPGPATFPLVDSMDLHRDLACAGTGDSELVVAGTAVLTDAGQQLYDVHFTKFRLVGSSLEVVDTVDHHGAGWGELLPLSQTPPNLCGAPIVAGAG